MLILVMVGVRPIIDHNDQLLSIALPMLRVNLSKTATDIPVEPGFKIFFKHFHRQAVVFKPAFRVAGLKQTVACSKNIGFILRQARNESTFEGLFGLPFCVQFIVSQ
jgi:hypothetical protein